MGVSTAALRYATAATGPSPAPGPSGRLWTQTPSPAASAPSPDPLTQMLRRLDSLVGRGPHAVADAVGRLAGHTLSNFVWLCALVAAALLVRAVAKHVIARVTLRLAQQPASTSRVRRVLRRAVPAQAASSAFPTFSASLNTLAERRRQRAHALGSLLSSVISGLLLVVVVLLIAIRAGMPGGALASAGVLGLGAAVFTQGLARDIVAGVFVLIEDTYGVGDYVDVNLGAAGVVEQIGLRTTRLRGPDGTVWHVRHSDMIRIGNRTQEQTLLQLDVTVGFPQIAADVTTGKVVGVVGVAELARAEKLVRQSLDRLDRDLQAALTVGNASGPSALPSTLAALVPELVADVSPQTLTKLADAGTGLTDTDPMPKLAGMLEELLEDADVPVLTETTVVGLAGANPTSVTVRVRARVADTSREQALGALRRRLFVDITSEGLSVAFAAVDPASM